MKNASSKASRDKKGHICPPSDASHPADRWETAFVYAFITRFTNLREKVEGLESTMDLENALLSPTQHPILLHVLSRFLLNLKPQTRNLDAEHISSTVSGVLQEYMKSSERTLFWNEDLHTNVEPLQGIEGGFWGAEWDLKLKILRQLVELQLSHHADTREAIDRAWGVIHNKHKKKDGTVALPGPSDPDSQERLKMIPIGQDMQRKRYWIVDDSPRLYVSTNPWKITAGFKSVATTRDDYLQAIQNLKDTSPTPKAKKEKASKTETAHLKLIETLETRLAAIDVELARVQRVRRRIEQRELLKAQAEVRETRTRRQTRRPDYVYHNEGPSEEDGDEYTFQEDEDDEEHIDDGFDYDMGGPSRRIAGQRRSQRAAVLNANGKRAASDRSSEWRGERRSTRLGNPVELQLPIPRTKRARTDESSVSVAPSEAQSISSDQKSLSTKGKSDSAAAVKANEIVLEQVAGKKKSKFWFYAVEPVPGSAAQTTQPHNGSEPFQMNVDHVNGGDSHLSDASSFMKMNGNGDANEGRYSSTPSVEAGLTPALS